MFVLMKTKKVITIVAKETVTADEIELVQMMANNLRAKDIAEKMGQDLKAVESRIFQLKKKYKAPTPAGLVMLFSRNSLIN
jgi:DNA-binding NarL/FixJ family response regulator